MTSRGPVVVRDLAIRTMAFVLLASLTGCSTTRPGVTPSLPCVRVLTLPAQRAVRGNAGKDSSKLFISVTAPDGKPIPGIGVTLTYRGNAGPKSSATQSDGVAPLGAIPFTLPKLVLFVHLDGPIVFALDGVPLDGEETWIRLTLDPLCRPLDWRKVLDDL